MALTDESRRRQLGGTLDLNPDAIGPRPTPQRADPRQGILDRAAARRQQMQAAAQARPAAPAVQRPGFFERIGQNARTAVDVVGTFVGGAAEGVRQTAANIGGAVAGAAGDVARGFSGPPAPVAAPARAEPVGAVGGSPPRRGGPRRPPPAAPGETPTTETPAPVLRPQQPTNGPPTFEEQSQALVRSGQEGFIGTRTGLRTLNADGTPTAARGPVTGSANFIAEPGAIGRPSTGALARDLGVSRPALADAQARAAGEIASAQARNQATRDRIAAGPPVTAAGEGVFRPGTGAGVGTAERADLIARQGQAAQAGRERLARQQLADTDAANRAAIAQMGEAGADRRQTNQLAAAAREGDANRAVQLTRPSQPMPLGDGTMAVWDPNTNGLVRLTLDGQPARPAQAGQLDQRALASLTTDLAAQLLGADPMSGRIDDGTRGGRMPTAEERAAAIAQATQMARSILGGAGAPAAPQPGEVRDGYRFRGGDPASAQSWEKVQ